MKYLFIFIYGCIITSCSTNKELDYRLYNPIAVEADSLYLADRFDLAFIKLDSVFNDYYPNVPKYDMSLYIKSAFLSNNDINQKKYFKPLFKKYNYNFQKMSWDSLLVKIYSDVGFSDRELNRYKKYHQRNSVKGLREKLMEMKIRDQLFRSDDFSDYTYQSKRDSVDAINEKELIYIFEKIGYPNETTHDFDERLTGISSILLHTSDSIRVNYFIPKMKIFVKNGACLPQILANIIDQYYLYSNDYQIYNSYLNDPILHDTATTKKLRKEIGLHPSLSIDHWIFYQSNQEYLESNPRFKNILLKNIFLNKN